MSIELMEQYERPEPGTVIGYRKNGDPIYVVAGGSPDEDAPADESVEDDAEEDADDSEEEADDAGRDDSEEGEGSSSKKKVSDKVDRAELQKVIKQRQDLKRRLREAEKRVEEAARQNETEAEKARREAAEAARAEAEKKLKPVLIEKHIRGELLAEGIAKHKIGRLIKLMDLDEVEVNDDNEVEGVEEQIEELREQFPELFRGEKPDDDDDGDDPVVEERPRKRRPSSRSVDAAPKRPARKPVNTELEILRRLRGGR